MILYTVAIRHNAAEIRPHTAKKRPYTAKKWLYIVIYGPRMLAVNTPYMTRRKYGRKTPTWFTAKYGTYSIVYDRKDTVFVSYTAVYGPYTMTVFNHPGNNNIISINYFNFLCYTCHHLFLI